MNIKGLEEVIHAIQKQPKLGTIYIHNFFYLYIENADDIIYSIIYYLYIYNAIIMILYVIYILVTTFYSRDAIMCHSEDVTALVSWWYV